MSSDDDTWIYLVNNSPWKADVVLPLKVPTDCQMSTTSSSAANSHPSAGLNNSGTGSGVLVRVGSTPRVGTAVAVGVGLSVGDAVAVGVGLGCVVGD